MFKKNNTKKIIFYGNQQTKKTAARQKWLYATSLCWRYVGNIVDEEERDQT